jgi:UDP-glucose 6-dehydrogenase
MKVLIIGTGYVGVNTGVVLAYLGNEVTCLDLNQEKIDLLNQGKSPVWEPHLEEVLGQVKENIRFTSSYDDARIPETDVIFIAVGTKRSCASILKTTTLTAKKLISTSSPARNFLPRGQPCTIHFIPTESWLARSVRRASPGWGSCSHR